MPAPNARHNLRKGRSVTPAMGASTTGGSTTSGPICGNSTSGQAKPMTSLANFSYTMTANRTFEMFGNSGAGSLTIDASGNNRQVNFSIKRFPSSGELAVRPENSDYGWTSYTPTLSAGFGTTSNVAFYHMRKGDSMFIKEIGRAHV